MMSFAYRILSLNCPHCAMCAFSPVQNPIGASIERTQHPSATTSASAMSKNFPNHRLAELMCEWEGLGLPRMRLLDTHASWRMKCSSFLRPTHTHTLRKVDFWITSDALIEHTRRNCRQGFQTQLSAAQKRRECRTSGPHLGAHESRQRCCLRRTAQTRGTIMHLHALLNVGVQ